MDQMEFWKEFLTDLENASKETRELVTRACARYLEKTGQTEQQLTREAMMAFFRAALDSMADLVQYGELGPAAIDKLHNTRRQCGIWLPEADERRGQGH